MLDGTALGSRISLGDSVTFNNITLKFTEDSYLFANGHSLTINESITMTNRIRVYGGGHEGSTVASTDLKIYGGSYEGIFGGSHGGTVTGDTNVIVGGNVNEGITPKHDSGLAYFVYGGGSADTVKGKTNVTFGGDAKAHYVFGGSYGKSAIVEKGTEVRIEGGRISGVYGGGKKSDSGQSGTITGGTHVVMTGGKVDQVFGANEASDLTGDVKVEILGGTVTRRIYGGCYNDYKLLGGWSTKYSVNGTITLILSGNATLDQSYDGDDYHGDDLSVFARSRRNPVSNDEVSVLIYVDDGENQHVSKLGAHDDNGIMSGVTAYDSCTTQ